MFVFAHSALYSSFWVVAIIRSSNHIANWSSTAGELQGNKIFQNLSCFTRLFAYCLYVVEQQTQYDWFHRYQTLSERSKTLFQCFHDDVRMGYGGAFYEILFYKDSLFKQLLHSLKIKIFVCLFIYNVFTQ